MGRPAKAIGAADGARTKEEIETRKQTEEKLKGGDKPKVTCPGYLTPSQKKIFNKIKKLLVDAGAAGGCRQAGSSPFARWPLTEWLKLTPMQTAP